MKHELTYVEDDPQGYGDGLSDFYRCTCGVTFQANGDVLSAFEHGQETAPTTSDGYEEQLNAR